MFFEARVRVATMTSADSPITIGVSPGKGYILLSMPAASTTYRLLSSGVVKMCSLTHYR